MITQTGTESELIYRQQAIDAIDEYMVGKNCAADGTMMARLINELVIKRLPSAQPKKGKWIVNGTLINCSVCKHSAWSRNAFEDIVRGFNFCPNCGADMREEENG